MTLSIISPQARFSPPLEGLGEVSSPLPREGLGVGFWGGFWERLRVSKIIKERGLTLEGGLLLAFYLNFETNLCLADAT